MRNGRFKKVRCGKRFLSVVLVLAMVITGIPAMEYFKGVTHADAAVTYEPKKIGVSLICRDMISSNADKVYSAVTRTNSLAEDSKNGSAFNNVNMLGLTYQNRHGDAGKSYWAELKSNKYKGLYDLAKKSQIEQSVSANVKNHNHSSFTKHWGKINQYCKIIFGYPKADNNDWFYGRLFETNDNPDYSNIGGNDYWDKMNPDRGYKNRLVIYMTAKKGCDNCSGAYIENVSVALKDTSAPTISGIKITSSADSDTETKYFKAGQTIYVRVKFSEYVRLADNNNSSDQSAGIKLGLSLGKENTKDVTQIYADLMSLKNDEAVFSYTVPSEVKVNNNNQDMDFFVSGLANIDKQGSLIVKSSAGSSSKFNRVFLDNNGKTLSYSSSTMNKLKSGVNDDNKFENEIKKTTSAITDIAGNSLDISCFRDDEAFKTGVGITRTYLDAVCPEAVKVELSSDQAINKSNDNANNYLKPGTKLTAKIEYNEKLKKISSEELAGIQAKFNLYGRNGQQVTAKAVGISYGDSTKITFEPVTVTGDMSIDPLSPIKKKTDYKITITDIIKKEVLKDYSDNSAGVVGDLRSDTSKDFFLDNEAPVIKIDNIAADDSKTYNMTKCDVGEDQEVYSIVIDTTDDDTVSGSDLKPFISGVMDGKGSLSVDLQSSTVSQFQYILSLKPLSNSDLSNKSYKNGESGKSLALYGTDDRNTTFTLIEKETHIYLYIKFIDSIDYASVNSGIKVNVTASDVNGNSASAVVKYAYEPADKIKPAVTYQGIRLKENNDNTAYQEAGVRIKDKGGIDINTIKYVWVEDGEQVPDISSYKLLPVDSVKTISTTEDGKVTDCLATIKTDNIGLNQKYNAGLYVYVEDVSGNETQSGRLVNANIDMSMPTLQISVPKDVPNKKSSVVINGPFTSSTNQVGMFVAVEDPLNEGYYFVKRSSGNASSIASGQKEFLDGEKFKFSHEYNVTIFQYMYYAQITQDGSEYTITNSVDLKGSTTECAIRRQRFMAIASDKYYGRLNVMAGTGFLSSAFSDWGTDVIKFDSSKGYMDEDSFIMIPDTYALSDKQDVEYNMYTEYTYKAVNVTIDARGNYGQQVDKSLCYNYNPESNKPEYLSSLKGAGFSINISNIRTNDFVTEDIDYDSENTYIKLKNVDTGYYVYEWELTEGVTDIDITIPDDLTLENGHYAVEVSIGSYVTEGDAKHKTATAVCDDIYLYDYSDKMTEAFGIDSVSAQVSFTAGDEYEDSERPPYYGYKSTGSYRFNRTVVDERSKDYTSDLKDAYDADTLYLGNCATDGDNDGDVISYDRNIKLSVNGMAEEDLDNYWIKMWTGDVANSKSARWFKFEAFNETDKTMSVSVKPVDAAARGMESPEAFYTDYVSGFTEKKFEIPVFEGSNTVSYQLMNIGGNKSEVHEVEVMYCKTAPVLDMEVDTQDKVTTETGARVTGLGSSLVTKDVNLYESDFSGKESATEPVTGSAFTYTENGRHLYYAIDGYGNLAFKQFYITNIDCYAPTASFKTVSPASYVSLDSDYGYMENAHLEIDVKDDKPLVGSNIEISVDDREAYTVDMSGMWDYGDGYAGTYIGRKQLNGTGMDNIQISFGPEADGRYYLYINIEMNDDIDSTKSDKEKAAHLVKVNVTDPMGNPLESILSTDGQEFYGLNNVPKISEVSCEPEGEVINVAFTGRVRVTSINGNEVPEKLYEHMDMMARFSIAKGEEMGKFFEGADTGDTILKDYFGISKDGTYEIEYVDVYDNKYTEEFKVEDFFGNYAADIEYSTLSKTNQNVIATITGADKNAVLGLSDKNEESDRYTVTWNKDKSKATVVFTENASVTFNLKVEGAAEAEKTVEYNVSVGNIDKKAPDDVQVTWVFKENGHIYTGEQLDIEQLQSLTTGNDIEVYISSPSEELYAVNGKELRHTFKYSEDMDRSYTFEYSDECGNEGDAITVTLPDELVMSEYEQPVPEEESTMEDTDAPSVAAEVYAIYDGIAEYKTSWNTESDSFVEVAEKIGYTGGYKIKYTLFDSSRSKIVVLDGADVSIDDITYESNSQSIDGVKVSEPDNSIIITKECSVTVVAVDEKGNKTSHSFTASKFDTEKPTVTVRKTGQSFTKMRLQFYLDDNTDAGNKKGTVVPVTSGLTKGMDEYGIYYYKDVDDNGIYNTTFKDRCGNKATAAANVSEIDNKAPVITVSAWSPCYVINGKAYEKLAPTEPVNSSVTLSLDFDKTVSELKVYYEDNGTWTLDNGTFSKTTIELGGRKGKVEFKDNVPGTVKVVAASPNGMSSELPDIDLKGIIDKSAPKITSDMTKGNNQVKVIYKADEKVLVTGCDRNTVYGAGTDIPLTIKKNGTYELTFTDMAGNVTTDSITVDSIDETPPDVYAAGIPKDYVTPQNCKIKVTMSEKGTIRFQGKEYSVKAPVDADGDGKYVGDELDWITLPINSNGNYQVMATDEAGLTSYKLLEVKFVDDTAPYIRFNKSVIAVSQGITKDEFEELLLDDSTFVLSDNVDKAPKITFENMLTDSELSNQGIYEVTYVLSDSAGNIRKVDRYVKVISSANIKVKANGELLTACDTTALYTDNVTVTLEKSKRTGESFKVYYKEGIRKAGSMKNAKVSGDGKLTDLNNGFYTLYIVTQNKESYLTYLYISK